MSGVNDIKPVKTLIEVPSSGPLLHFLFFWRMTVPCNCPAIYEHYAKYPFL